MSGDGAAAERDPDLLLLHCDEDLNDCEWSSMLGAAITPKPAESDCSNQEQPDEPKRDQQPAKEEDEAETKKPSCQDSGNGALIKPQTELQKKEHPLYSLRRNPKRSRRFIDHEYSLDGILPASGQVSAPAPAPAPLSASSPVQQFLPSTKKNAGFSESGANNAFGSNNNGSNHGNASTTPAGSSSTPATTAAPEKARACTECGKEFSSWKALFGHMRCHPEREWRGIQRPENLSEYKLSSRPSVRRSSKKARQQQQQARVVARPVMGEHEELETMYTKLVASDNESDTESIEAVYINGSCNSSGVFNSSRCGRIVTGKRSKRSRQQQQQQQQNQVSNSSSLQLELSSPAQAEFKEESLDMARCLVMLACAGRSLGGGNGYNDEAVADAGPDDRNDEEEGTSTTNDIVQDEKQDVPSGSSNEMELEEEDEEVMAIINNVGQQEEEEQEEERMGEQNQDKQDHVHLDSSVFKDEPEDLLMFNGPAELLDQQDLESIRMKYECSTCKRIFKSHQALGGHRASHKKVKGCFAKTNLNSMSEMILVHHLQDVDDEASTMNLDDEFLKSDEKLLPSDFMDQQPTMLSSLSTFSALQAHHLQQHNHPHPHPHHHHHHHLQQQFHHSYEAASMFNFSRHSNDLEMPDWPTTSSSSSSRRLVNSLKGHECSICHRVFTSGQALGGHKRCHWGGTEQRPVAEALLSSSSNGSKTIQLHQQQVEQPNPLNNNSVAVLKNSLTAREEFVDLNLPALVAEDEEDEEGENVEEGDGCVAVLSYVAAREGNEDDEDELAKTLVHAKAAPEEEQDNDNDAQQQQEPKITTSFHDEDLYKKAAAAFSPCKVLETLPLPCI